MIETLTYYLIAINFAAFAAFGIDKALAEGGHWRIAEKTLLLLALFGGLPGALAGRQLFRHKTRKKSFSDALAVVAILWALGAGALGWMTYSGGFDRRGAAPPAIQRAPAAPPAAFADYDFANCDEAWEAGAAPFQAGSPGYRPEWDGDGDGVACEPYP